MIFYFEDDDRPPLRGEILAVNSYGLEELTPQRLRLSDGDNVDGYIGGLPPGASACVVQRM
ncbi:MAG: hypothetical protein QM650_00830 [Microlunatus sp.]